jgi:hypothetical protein
MKIIRLPRQLINLIIFAKMVTYTLPKNLDKIDITMHLVKT